MTAADAAGSGTDRTPAHGLASERIAALGLTLPTVAVPIGSYRPAVRVGDLVHTSGQLPVVSGVPVAVGKVGAEVSAEQAADAARTAALNAVAAVAAIAGGVDEISRIVKVVVFVASAADFTAQPAVANGASELLGEIFGEAGIHARSAVGVASLPMNAPVEVELIARIAS